jgi:sulfoxide reductase heme-binding subunit YedZ
VLLVPLALTSTAGMIRRLGGRTWRRLHRLVYATAALGVVHYWWLVKLDTRPPRNYAILLALLLLVRVWIVVKARRERRRA